MRKKILDALKQQGYSERSAGLVADELAQLSPDLMPLLNAWLTNETLDYAAHGYSIKQFMEKRQMTYPAALLTMDWLIKDPVKAIDSLNRKVR